MPVDSLKKDIERWLITGSFNGSLENYVSLYI